MIKKHLKIAIIHLAFFYSGGGEKLILEEIKGLKKRGHQVDCYTPTLDRKLCYPDIIKKYKIQVIFPLLGKILFHHESMEIAISCLLFPYVAGRFKKYDIIIGANQPGPWFGWLIKRLTGVPYIIYLAQPTRILYPRLVDKKTGIWIRQKVRIFPFLVRMFKPFIRWIDTLSIQNAGRVLVNGEYMAGVISRVYHIPCVNCPAGAYVQKYLTQERWQGKLKANGWEIKKPYILVSNRHFPQKKFEYVIRALPEIAKAVENITVVITGNMTIYTKKLIELASKLGVRDRIIFTGYVKEMYLNDLYANAVVYAYTAPEEDFGMGVIESMAAGVPVVAWDKGGPSKTIINQKTGLLVNPYSTKEFSRALLEMIGNPKANERMGKAARERVKKYFSYKQHLDRLEKELLDVNENKHNSFVNEKIIFGYGEASTSLTDDNRGAILFYSGELKKLNSNDRTLKVLDVGSGAGNKTKVLKQMFPKWQFWGCDINKNAIEEAKREPAAVNFFVADAELLPVASDKFDVVIMHSVLDHTQHPAKAAKEAWRVLKRGGVYMLMDPIETEPATIHGQLRNFSRFRQHRKERLGHNYAFSKKSLVQLLNKAGFEVEKVVLDWFYFAQLVDIVYYPLLLLTGKGPEFTLKKYISDKSTFSDIVSGFKKFITVIINVESDLTLNIPLGFLAYIVAKKTR